MNGEPNDIERAAIEEHAQRTAEQSALRKVRKTLDGIEAAEAGERRSLRKILVVCAILVLLGAWLSWELIFSDKGMPRQQPMKVPAALQKQ
ncbi:MAG: hypothetical protein IH604_03415 [Burkholderiales bacterium]|nr:hypothetical protein [Burkholderiales bacterium]